MSVDTSSIGIRRKLIIPSVQNRDNACSVDGDALESRLRHVEVLQRVVAPAASVVGMRVVLGAEVGCGDLDRALAVETPSLGVASDLKTGPTNEPVVEESGAQGCCVGPVSSVVEIPISTRSA